MMSPVEYTSLTVMISSIKHQLAALETVIAAMSNAQQAPVTKTRKPAPIDAPHELSLEEETQVEDSIEAFRKAEMARMAKHAEEYFVQAMDKASQQEPE